MATADPFSGEFSSDEPVSSARQPRSRLGLRPLAIALVAVVAGASLFLSGFALGGRVATTPGTPTALEQEFAPFWDVFDLIKERYAGGPTPTDKALVAAAIDGMMSSLKDRWSFYQPPQDFQAALQSVGGHGVGIGVQAVLQPAKAGGPACGQDAKVGSQCELAVQAVIPNSPAEKAGVQAGDVFERVDGKTLDGLTVEQATAIIRGEQDTKVSILFERGTTPVTLTITRAVFDVPQVDTKVLAGGAVQYIHVSGINSVAQSEFHAALATALAANRHVFIVDLRGNGGGYVESAVAMANEFLSSGVILYQVDASGAETVTQAKAGGQASDPANRVVLLTDQQTASAAEILAAALQGNGRAKLVGDHTFGKGVVQAWIELPEQLGGVHLTIARWLTPQHVWINGQGLRADVPVDGSNARAGTDPVLDGALANLGYPPTASSSPGASAPAPSSPQPSAPAATPVPSPTVTR